MNHKILIVPIALVATGVLTDSADAGVSSPDIASQTKVDACVAEIAARADYSGAVRVRHDVVSKKRSRPGYKLRIDTTVYGDTSGKIIRQYAATCVVAQSGTPITFDIQEIGASRTTDTP